MAAISFLTRLPVAPPASSAPVASPSFGAAAFGLVGAAIGVVASVPLIVPGPAAPSVGALLAVALLAISSGALHLDGLADTADALVAHRPEGAERARRDPAVGAAGAVALVLVLALEAAALSQLLTSGGSAFAALALVLAVAVGRAVAVGLAIAGRSLVTGGGLAAAFAGGVSARDALLAAAVPLAVLVVAAGATRSTPLVAGLVAGVALAILLAAVVVRARGSLDGDGLGAGVQLAEAAVLAVAAIAVAWPAARPG
jgi:adenosylcobinamide-GDP ribazoletransferase